MTVLPTEGVRSQVHNKFIAAGNGKHPWSTNAYVETVRELEHHDDVRSGIFAHEFSDKQPHEWTKQASVTLEVATEMYMGEVTAEFHC